MLGCSFCGPIVCPVRPVVTGGGTDAVAVQARIDLGTSVVMFVATRWVLGVWSNTGRPTAGVITVTVGALSSVRVERRGIPLVRPDVTGAVTSRECSGWCTGSTGKGNISCYSCSTKDTVDMRR